MSDAAPHRRAGFLRANAPFLSAGALIAFTSSYGQTFFISLFAAQILTAFGLTDGQWGLVYAGATTASAALMVFVGPLTDRLRIRALAALTCVGLALACLTMAIAWHWTILVLTVFALRLMGQGMMSHLAALAMARWFVATRGRALAISAMGFAFGQAALPMIFVAAMASVDWRLLWVVAALMALVPIPVLARLLRLERTPMSHAKETPAFGMDGRHWTRMEMLCQPLFWLLIPLILGPPAFGTALFFHQVHLTAVKGWDLAEYVALMPIFVAVQVTTTLISGSVLDRIGAGRMMMVYMLPFALGFTLMGSAETLLGAALALAVFGIGTGLQPTVPTAFWAEFFGTRHLGGIKALATALMVLGSAIGPGLTGVVIDAGTAFPGQMIAIAIYFLAAAVLATVGILRVQRRLR